MTAACLQFKVTMAIQVGGIRVFDGHCFEILLGGGRGDRGPRPTFGHFVKELVNVARGKK